MAKLSAAAAAAMADGRVLRTIGGPPPKPAAKAKPGPTRRTPGKGKPLPSVIGRDMAEEDESDEEMEEVVIQPPPPPPRSNPTSQPMSRNTSAAPSHTTDGTQLTSTPQSTTGRQTGTGGVATEDESVMGAASTNGEDTADETNLPYDYGFDLDDGAQALNLPVAGSSTGVGTTDGGPVVITLGKEMTEEAKKKRMAMENRRKPLTSRDRALRLEAHKMHATALLANASVRNKWCSDGLLKARLLSLLPNPIHQAFHITPSTYPDIAKRSRLFLEALQTLASWWANDFFEIPHDFRTVGIRTRTWDDVMELVDDMPRLKRDVKGKGKEDADDEYTTWVERLGQGGERIRTVKSMQKKALQGYGGRDTSAQLFVSLCRAMGLGARLVVSLQPVNWRAEKNATPNKKVTLNKEDAVEALRMQQEQEEAASSPTRNQPPVSQLVKAAAAAVQASKSKRSPKKKIRRKGKAVTKTQSEEDDDDAMEEVIVPTPGMEDDDEIEYLGSSNGQRLDGMPVVKPKKHMDELYRLKAPKPQRLSGGTMSRPKKKAKEVDLTTQPPVFWAEVYSRPDQKWIPVDPSRGTIKRRKDYEPSTESGPIRLLYVVAFEEDGYAREVTIRYAQAFGAKTSKLRAPVGKDGNDWWEKLMKTVERPYRLKRDDLEDAELQTSQISEGMPMVVQGFKDHPLYVLERHLKREQVIIPKREVGRFRGEAVYRRENVLSTKTPENWMRIGRKVKPREEPLKWVKMRAVTLDKRRAQELAEMEGKEPMQQGLYAEWQTDLFRPPPIKDGKIPVNSFGNIDLYVPTMLPEGAVHLPYKGIAKVAKQLGINYAEACTGFEFKKQRAIPVITGIVVAEGQEEALLDAYWQSAAVAEEKELLKRQEKALKKWQRLIHGIQIRSRLQEQYADGKEVVPTNRQTNGDEEKPVEPSKGNKIILKLNKTANTATDVSHELGQAPSETDAPMATNEQVDHDAPALNGSDAGDALIEQPTRITPAKRGRPARTPAKPKTTRLARAVAPAPAAGATPRRSLRSRDPMADEKMREALESDVEEDDERE